MAIAAAFYVGLQAIADAIRNKKIHVTLPTIEIILKGKENESNIAH